MIVGSFVELGINLFIMGRTFWRERKDAEKTKLIDDPSPPEDQVSWKLWAPLLVIMVVVQIVVLSKVFGVNAGIAVLSIILGFIWSFIAVQSAGVTGQSSSGKVDGRTVTDELTADVNPVSTTAKCSQLVVGGITQGFNYPVNDQGWMPKAALENLWAGCVAGGAAAQSCDMVSDLKTAFLLKVRPLHSFQLPERPPDGGSFHRRSPNTCTTLRVSRTEPFGHDQLG